MTSPRTTDHRTAHRVADVLLVVAILLAAVALVASVAVLGDVESPSPIATGAQNVLTPIMVATLAVGMVLKARARRLDAAGPHDPELSRSAR